MSVRIVVDSTADLRDGLQARLTVVPLTIHFGEEEYIDGVTIDGHGFYEKLVESDAMPTTSQATPYQFQQVFEAAVEAGDSVVCITVASKLSGTYQSAVIAADDYDGQVFVVDSESVAIGSGILAEYALRLADEGKTAAEIAQAVTEIRGRVRVLAMLDTLEYLKKGGRISPAAAMKIRIYEKVSSVKRGLGSRLVSSCICRKFTGGCRTGEHTAVIPHIFPGNAEHSLGAIDNVPGKNFIPMFQSMVPGWHNIVIRNHGVHRTCLPQLLQIAGALRRIGLAPGRIKCREQHSRQNGDNSNHYQKFDQSKRVAFHFISFHYSAF